MKKKYLGLIVAVAIIGFICVFAGVTYAVFNYRKEGKVDNVITSGKITFRYDEDSVNGINLTSAVPMTDRKGASLESEENVFNFSVSTEGTDAVLYYDIELALTENSNLDPSIVKVYLAEVVDGVEVPQYTVINNGIIRTYTELNDNNDLTAKSIGNGNFQISNDSQEKQYRLKVWIDKEADFSPLTNEDGTYQEDENGNYIYPYNGKKFEVRVNVKAGAKVEDEEGICFGCGDVALGLDDTFIMLSDNSKWRILSENSETIKLIYDGYIDKEGKYSNVPVLMGSYEANNVLNTFSNMLKSSLNDENIVVSIPSMKDFKYHDWFDQNYSDDYFLDYREIDFSILGGKYYLSDMSTSYGSWKIEDYRITHVYFEYESVGLKPVITVSSDYRSSFEYE